MSVCWVDAKRTDRVDARGWAAFWTMQLWPRDEGPVFDLVDLWERRAREAAMWRDHELGG